MISPQTPHEPKKSGFSKIIVSKYNNVGLQYALPNQHRIFLLDYQEFFTGWCSAFINICITFPINKVIFRQVLHDLSPRKAIKQISNEGIYILYRGILPPLLQKTTTLSLMFGVYEGARVPLAEFLPLIGAKTTAAMIAGTAEAILTPFERVQTLLQDHKYQQEFKNTRHAFRQIGFEYGLAEYYRGLVPILWRNGPSNVLYFLLRDAARERVHFIKSDNVWSQAARDFICGGLIGGFISTVFFPLNVIKVHVQSKLGGEFQSLLDAIRQIYGERGSTIGCFYRGVHLNYTRGFLSWGIVTVSTDFIKRNLFPVMPD